MPPAEDRDLRLPARSWSSPAARRTAGWPPGRWPTTPCRTRSTRSPSPTAVADVVRGTRPAGLTRDRRRIRPRPPGRTCSTSLLAGEDLDADEAALGDGPDHGRRGLPGAGGRLPRRRCAPRGRRSSELRGPRRRRCSRTPTGSRSPGRALDIVGTGGDRLHTVNISTMAAIVIAASGVRVVKHGNRAASSSSGSADVLEALGVDLTLPPGAGRRGGDRGRASPSASPRPSTPRCDTPAVPRRDLGVGTAFNFLGPLTNPAQPDLRRRRGAPTRAWPRSWPGSSPTAARAASVFRGDDGLDELTVATTSTVWWVRDGAVTELSLDPERRRPRAAPGRGAARRGRRAQRRGGPRPARPARPAPVRDAVRAQRRCIALADAPGCGSSTVSRTTLDARPCAGASDACRGRHRLRGGRGGARPVGRAADGGRAAAWRSGPPSRPRLNAASRSCGSRCGTRCGCWCRATPDDLVEPVGDDVGELLVRRGPGPSR